jgi:hypothetical protein
MFEIIKDSRDLKQAGRQHDYHGYSDHDISQNPTEKHIVIVT